MEKSTQFTFAIFTGESFKTTFSAAADTFNPNNLRP